VRNSRNPPVGYQPQNLIKSTESRFRDGITGDSQHIQQSRDYAYFASELTPTQVDGNIEKEVVAKDAIVPSFHSKAPEWTSVEQAPAQDAIASLLAAGYNRTGTVKNSDVVLLLSIDDNRQQQLLQETAALWQVSSFLAHVGSICQPSVAGHHFGTGGNCHVLFALQ
jgi:hypothetical protein